MESDTEVDLEGIEDNSAKREFDKMQRSLISSGFREGASAGKEASFQSGFDAGYAGGFEAAFSLGKFNGVLEALKRNAETLSVDVNHLEGCSFENTRHGLCTICKENSENSTCEKNSEQSCRCKSEKCITQTPTNQRAIVKKVLEDQKLKCLTILEKAGVIDLVSAEQR